MLRSKYGTLWDSIAVFIGVNYRALFTHLLFVVIVPLCKRVQTI